MKALFTLFVFITSYTFSQQPHLEIGAKIGFKDEFHLAPTFDLNSKYTEIHVYEAYAFGRVSRRRLGLECGLGFEKAANYFIRFQDNSKEFAYLNLNRLFFDLSPYLYLIKTPKEKWDVQLGIRNYVTFNNTIWIPNELSLKRWKLSARIATNYTFKSFIIGVFYEHDLRTDYSIETNQNVFGLSLGVIY